MAEVFAIVGGAAAVTQLIHYGLAAVPAISALSRHVRHAPERIESWTDQSMVMISLLDNIQNCVTRLDENVERLLRRCRKNADLLTSLLQPFHQKARGHKPSKFTVRTFVLKNEEEIERLLASLRNAFTFLASQIVIIGLIAPNTLPTPNNPEYLGPHRSGSLFCSLCYLNSRYDLSFAEPRALLKGHDLYNQVTTALTSTLESPADAKVFAEASYMAFRYCMYLLTIGRYALVLEFLHEFQDWSRNLLPANFEAATALCGKHAAAQALQGDHQSALELLRQIHHSRKASLGKSDIGVAHSLNGLGLVHHAMGDYKNAAHHHRKALAFKSTFLGPDDPDTLVSVNNLGLVYHSRGRNAVAEQMFRRSLSGWMQVYSHDDLLVLAAKSNLGIALFSQGHLGEAEELHRYVFDKRRRILGDQHHETMKSKVNLAMTLNEVGRHARAVVLYSEAIQVLDDELGLSHPDALKTRFNLATALHDQGRFSDAEATLAITIPHVRAKYGINHAETVEAMEFRAILLQHLGRYSKALSIATKVYKARCETLGHEDDDTQRSLAHVRALREDCEEVQILPTFPIVVPIAAG